MRYRAHPLDCSILFAAGTCRCDEVYAGLFDPRSHVKAGGSKPFRREAVETEQIGIASGEPYRFVEVDQVRPRRSDY